MSCNIRLHGTKEEVAEMLEMLKENKRIEILSESKPYKDRGQSQQIRVYIDAEVKN